MRSSGSTRSSPASSSLPAFYALGAGIYQIYYLSFEKRGQESLRGLAFFFGLLFITEVTLVLYFGVDYRYVEARLYRPDLAYRRPRHSAAHSGAVPGVAADDRSAAAFPDAHLSRPRHHGGGAGPARPEAHGGRSNPHQADCVRHLDCERLAGRRLSHHHPAGRAIGRTRIYRSGICDLRARRHGQLAGNVIAAMLVGIVESLTSTFYGPSWAPAVSFGFLLLTLAVRPAGLLGR